MAPESRRLREHLPWHELEGRNHRQREHQRAFHISVLTVRFVMPREGAAAPGED
jgi:hypothetical protein